MASGRPIADKTIRLICDERSSASGSVLLPYATLCGTFLGLTNGGFPWGVPLPCRSLANTTLSPTLSKALSPNFVGFSVPRSTKSADKVCDKVFGSNQQLSKGAFCNYKNSRVAICQFTNLPALNAGWFLTSYPSGLTPTELLSAPSAATKKWSSK